MKFVAGQKQTPEQKAAIAAGREKARLEGRKGGIPRGRKWTPEMRAAIMAGFEKAKADGRLKAWARSKVGRPMPAETRAKLSAGAAAARLKRRVGVCDICHEEKYMNKDHDHVTGKTRGDLCTPCNTVLGHMKDNPKLLRDAADYLERWS